MFQEQLPLVGRDADLRLLELVLGRAAAGTGSVVLLSGEAGIGKTRLCQELSRSHRSRGGQVLVGRAFPEEAAISFGPIADTLRTARRSEPPLWQAASARASVLWAIRSSWVGGHHAGGDPASPMDLLKPGWSGYGAGPTTWPRRRVPTWGTLTTPILVLARSFHNRPVLAVGGLMTWQGLMASVVHRALDGAAATFQSSLPLDGPFTSVVNVRMHERLQEFTAGARSLGRAVAADHGIAHFDETYSFQGGRLSLGEVDVYDPGLKLAATFRLAVWEGERFSIHTHVYDQESSDLIRILRRFTFVEGETGVAIQPRDRGRTPFDDSASILKEIPGLGLLEVTGRTAATSVGLPAWRGTRTAGGELFRDTVDNRQDYFVLVSPEMKATIIPDPNSDPTTILPHLDELTVRWRP